MSQTALLVLMQCRITHSTIHCKDRYFFGGFTFSIDSEPNFTSRIVTHPTPYFTPCFSHVINVKKSCSLTFAQILMLWYCKIPTLYNASAFANCSPLDKVIFVCVPQYDKVHLQTLTCPESIWISWHVSQRGTLDMVQSLTRAKHPLRLTKSSRGFHIIREMPTELYQRYHSRACIAADITPGRRAHFKWLQIHHGMGNLNLFEVG